MQWRICKTFAFFIKGIAIQNDCLSISGVRSDISAQHFKYFILFWKIMHDTIWKGFASVNKH